MCAAEGVEAKTVSLRMQPGETRAEFIERVRLARGPLTPSEIARLRKIFAPGERLRPDPEGCAHAHA